MNAYIFFYFCLIGGVRFDISRCFFYIFLFCFFIPGSGNIVYPEEEGGDGNGTADRVFECILSKLGTHNFLVFYLSSSSSYYYFTLGRVNFVGHL